MTRTRPVAVAALLVAGCSLAPRYERPAPPVSDAWSAEGATASGAPSDAIGWRDVFKDPRLQAIVSLALANNRDLRVAALNAELTRAQYRIERADRLPAIGGSAGATRQHLGDELSRTGAPTTTTTWTVGLGMSAFELDFFGRVRSLSDAALEQYLATEEARRSAHLVLVGDVAIQYLNLLGLEDQVDLARRTLEAVESSA